MTVLKEKSKVHLLVLKGSMITWWLFPVSSITKYFYNLRPLQSTEEWLHLSLRDTNCTVFKSFESESTACSNWWTTRSPYFGPSYMFHWISSKRESIKTSDFTRWRAYNRLQWQQCEYSLWFFRKEWQKFLCSHTLIEWIFK